MKIVFALPLILAACTPALECVRDNPDPKTGILTCERQMEREGERNAPPHEAPEHDPEPHRVDNEAAHDAWQERNGL